MGNYLIRVMAAAVVGTVAELIPPDGEEKESRIASPVTALLLLCTIALPLLDGIADGPAALGARIEGWFDQIEEADAAAADAYVAQTMAYICTAGAAAAGEEIAALLAERFGLPPARCRAEVTLADTDEGIVLREVRVFLSGTAIFADSYAIEAYLIALFGGQAAVIIE